MRRSLISKIALALALIAAGYFGALALRTNLLAEQGNQWGSWQSRKQFDADKAAIAAEREKPRFKGVIDGIFITPGGSIPSEYTTAKELCGTQQSKVVSWDKAGQLDLTLDLPKEYTLQEPNMDTVVVACGDTVFNARRAYHFKQHEPLREQGELVIGRSLIRYDEVDTAVDRPEIMNISGRDVVVIGPITDDGAGQNMRAYFPEPFGKTFIQAYNMPRKDFLELVTLVASSTH